MKKAFIILPIFFTQTLVAFKTSAEIDEVSDRKAIHTRTILEEARKKMLRAEALRRPLAHLETEHENLANKVQEMINTLKKLQDMQKEPRPLETFRSKIALKNIQRSSEKIDTNAVTRLPRNFPHTHSDDPDMLEQARKENTYQHSRYVALWRKHEELTCNIASLIKHTHNLIEQTIPLRAAARQNTHADMRKVLDDTKLTQHLTQETCKKLTEAIQKNERKKAFENAKNQLELIFLDR